MYTFHSKNKISCLILKKSLLKTQIESGQENDVVVDKTKEEVNVDMLD